MTAAGGLRRVSSDVWMLLLLAGALFLLHLLTNGQYGFHRDELATVDDAGHLAWGYVAYPPLTPAIARLALNLAGPSLVGLRAFSAAAQCVVLIVTGLMAGELGGGRWAKLVAALAVAVGPISLIQGALFQYVSFDFLWWALTAYFVLRLLNSEDPRWWLAIGATAGLGLETRYTIGVLLIGLAAGALLTARWRWLASRWLWGGVALAVVIWLPNLLWQVQQGLISLQFLSAIHARDVALGRARGYLPEQLFVSTNPLTLPLWLVGLWFYFFSARGRRYRLLGWLYLIPAVLLLVLQGRSYYLAPAYPALLAAGSVVLEHWLAERSVRVRRVGQTATLAILALAGAVGGALSLPIAPVQSPLWILTSKVQDNFAEEIGWPELVATVAGIYTGLPPETRQQTGILAGNYGEAGAIDLYGPALGLPTAISGADSYWLRGYPDPPPQNLIVLGDTADSLGAIFVTCDEVGRVTNSADVRNEETAHPQIFLCREPRTAWAELWPMLREFE
ncbi:MAG: glycosyltransferase family 39 protein [Chloroflexi bacterium]|nr:glycosyltransferase family 39 protein [Chloroflexota bacterium]